MFRHKAGKNRDTDCTWCSRKWASDWEIEQIDFIFASKVTNGNQRRMETVKAFLWVLPIFPVKPLIIKLCFFCPLTLSGFLWLSPLLISPAADSQFNKLKDTRKHLLSPWTTINKKQVRSIGASVLMLAWTNIYHKVDYFTTNA